MPTRLEKSPDEVEIFSVRSADSLLFQEIATLGVLAWGREPTAAEVEERARRLEEEVRMFDPDRRGLFAASKAGVIVGFGRVVRDQDHPSRRTLLGLVVHPDHRRQGVGSLLAQARIAYARERGATVIRSETHLDNEASIRYHESIGFENVGRFRAPDGDEKVAFRLKVRG